MMRRGQFGRPRNDGSREGTDTAVTVNLNDDQNEQINSTRRLNVSPGVIRKHNMNIIHFQNWLKEEDEKSPDLLEGDPPILCSIKLKITPLTVTKKSSAALLPKVRDVSK
jgi:hypothetical protein